MDHTNCAFIFYHARLLPSLVVGSLPIDVRGQAPA